MASALHSDAPPFREFLRRHRRARNLTQEALAERAGVSVRAVSDLERGVRTHPYPETANMLADALGLAGDERVSFLAAARRRKPTNGHASLPGNGVRLPSPFTRLVGRDDDLAAIVGSLRDERTRLLTLSGPAGVGKTRLAIESATRLHDAFPDGIHFIDLVPLQDPALVEPTIAAALGLRDQGTIPLADSLSGFLSSRRILFVIDNFEHLLDAAPVVNDLLHYGPGVQVLVTSRAVLRLRGEREYPVAPLLTPDPEAASPDFAHWPAIRLFVERAEDARPGFELTRENAPEVVAICHRVDGLPLAIELAAARIKLLSPTALATRLEQRLPMLTGGTRDAPYRQRTLEAAIAWSYDLLANDEQVLFRCLSVFDGGWTLEAAEAVGRSCGVADVLAALAALLDQSLIVRVDDGPEPRYRMLESIREYAAVQRVAAGEDERAHRALLAYLLMFVRENDLEPIDAELETRLSLLASEEANLRAGIAWALEHDPLSALRLGAGLGYFWFLDDRPAAGQELTQRILATGAGENLPDRARLLLQAATHEIVLCDWEAADEFAGAAVEFAEQRGDTLTAAHARIWQGVVADYRGDAISAQSKYEEAQSQFELQGDIWGQILCLTEMGNTAGYFGDAAADVAYYERVGAIITEHRLPNRYRVHYLAGLAQALRELGRDEEAFAACTEALALPRESVIISRRVGGQLTLADILLDRGDVSSAASRVGAALDDFWEIGQRMTQIAVLEVAASVASRGHHAAPATRLIATVACLLDQMSFQRGGLDSAVYERLLADLHAALDEEEFSREWRVGQARSLAESAAEAQAVMAMLAVETS